MSGQVRWKGRFIKNKTLDSLFLEPSINQLSPSPGKCARPVFQSSMVDKLTLYFLSKRYRGDVLSLIIFMTGLFAMSTVAFSFFEITVLEFSPILQAALLASAVMVRCRGSSPISAPNAIAGEDLEAPVIPLRISPLSLSILAMAVFCLTLLHQTIDA